MPQGPHFKMQCCILFRCKLSKLAANRIVDFPNKIGKFLVGPAFAIRLLHEHLAKPLGFRRSPAIACPAPVRYWSTL
jgi:hypothetical protein